MNSENCGFFDRENLGQFLGLGIENINFTKSSDKLFFEKLIEEFESKKNKLFSLLKDIRHFTRKEQASIIKKNYGTKSITSKICFHLLDSVDSTIPNEMEKELFIFCSKFVDK